MIPNLPHTTSFTQYSQFLCGIQVDNYWRRLRFVLNHSKPNQHCISRLFERKGTRQIPSYNPSPLVAHVAWMYQLLCLKLWSPNLSVISAAFMALGRSCLLAKTRRRASRSSSSLSIRWSSSRASETRSRSLESTTKMMPWVFWKSIEQSASVHIMRERQGQMYSVSKEDGSYPALRHPRRWSWCSCIPLFRHWTLHTEISLTAGLNRWLYQLSVLWWLTMKTLAEYKDCWIEFIPISPSFNLYLVY